MLITLEKSCAGAGLGGRPRGARAAAPGRTHNDGEREKVAGQRSGDGCRQAVRGSGRRERAAAGGGRRELAAGRRSQVILRISRREPSPQHVNAASSSSSLWMETVLGSEKTAMSGSPSLCEPAMGENSAGALHYARAGECGLADAAMNEAGPVNELALQAILYVGYLGRLCDAVHLFTVQDKFLTDQGLDGVALSMILMSGYLGEIISRFTVGPLIDVLGGRNSFLFLCNLSTAVTSVLFASGTSLPYFCASWLLNSLFMCNTLSAIVRVVSEHVPKERQGRVLGVLGTGNLLGDVFARFVLGYFVSVGFGWRGIVYVATALNVAMNVPALLFLPASPAQEALPAPAAATPAADADKDPKLTRAGPRRHKMTSGSEAVHGHAAGRHGDAERGLQGASAEDAAGKGGATPGNHLQARAARLWTELIRPIVTQLQFWVLCVMAVALIGTREFFMAFCAPFLTRACATSPHSSASPSLPGTPSPCPLPQTPTAPPRARPRSSLNASSRTRRSGWAWARQRCHQRR